MMRNLVYFLQGLRTVFGNPRVQGLLAMTLTLITCASLFYWYVEGWGLVNSVYFSVMTISTVGYGDLAPETVAGKLFTIFYVLCGLGLFMATATALAEQFIEQKKKRDNKGKTPQN